MFEVGKKVVCVEPFKGTELTTGEIVTTILPQVNEVYFVDEIIEDEDGLWLRLDGFDFYHLFDSKHFQPLSDMTIEQFLEEMVVEEYELVNL